MITRLSPILFRTESGHLAFWCPGCHAVHSVPVEGPNAWDWNQDAIEPTLRPSILVTCANGDPNARCHSFVESGMIRFLKDSSHRAAGSTLFLPLLPDRIPCYEPIEE
jgi:hypothetical protein